MYAKSSKTEAANEDQWQKFNMKYLPRPTRAVESHVLLPSVMGDKHRVQQWDAGAEGAKDMKFPLKSVTCACWGLTERSCRRDAKHFLRTHKSLFSGFPLARSSLRRWCLLFITNTLKDEQPHEPLRVTPPPQHHRQPSSSLQCLLMTRTPVCNSLNRQDGEEAAKWVMKCGFHNHVYSSV